MNIRIITQVGFFKNLPKTSRVITVCALLLGLIILFSGGFWFFKSQNSAIVTSNKCDDNLWQYVHSPSRLKILNKCIEVTGVIVFERHDPDGDTHLRLRLDKQFEALLNSRNRSAEGGNLVLEPICDDKATQADSVKTCLRYKGEIESPPVGSRVKVVGRYVLDKLHGWNEIHPVSSIKKLN